MQCAGHERSVISPQIKKVVGGRAEVSARPAQGAFEELIFLSGRLNGLRTRGATLILHTSSRKFADRTGHL